MFLSRVRVCILFTLRKKEVNAVVRYILYKYNFEIIVKRRMKEGEKKTKTQTTELKTSRYNKQHRTYYCIIVVYGRICTYIILNTTRRDL